MSSSGIVALRPRPGDFNLYPGRFDGSGPLHCAASPDSIIIYPAVPGSHCIPMHVLDSDSIASVKFRLQGQEGFPGKIQRLVCHGRDLARNDGLVRDYGVADGNIVHIVLPLSEVRVFSVKTVCGRRYKFKVEGRRTVKYVKQQVAKQDAGFSDLDNHKLVCDGVELEDQSFIKDICKDNDALVLLLVDNSAKIRTRRGEKSPELSIVASGVPEEPPQDILQLIASKPPRRNALIEPVVVNPKVCLPSVIKDLLRSTLIGLEKGNTPVLSPEGSGGVYFMKDERGRKNIAVFKPMDEEPMAENNPRGLPMSLDGEGLKRGTRVGEGALREIAAYILDHPVGGRRSDLIDEAGFSGVPPTCMVRCLHHVFNQPERKGYRGSEFKTGSLQKFVENDGSCEDMGPRAFPVQEVHNISVLDMRLANADRHAGNILVQKEREGGNVLIPIDHGYCLPESFEDCTFEWLYWPQARQPFNPETTDYIRSLDAEQDIALLKFYGWEPSLECSRTLRISTMLLKKGVERGLTAYDIGSILCRETVKKESKIEEIIREAQEAVLPASSESVFLETVSEIMNRYLTKLTQ